jgi:hypothetical protein
METLADFVARLSKDVGCYYHLLPLGAYALKRNNTMQRGQMGVFGFIRKMGDVFRIHTSEETTIAAGIHHLFDGTINKLFFGSPGSYIYLINNSIGEDYQRAVTAFTAIKNLNN